jgi:competence protein ComGF
LEALVALFVLSGSFLLFLGMTKLFHEEINKSRIDYTQDWQLFCTLMRNELEGARLEKVENNYLYVNKRTPLRFGLSAQGDFRKTNADGRGYQPLIHDLKKAEIVQNEKQIKIVLVFKQGGEHIFYYQFIEE